MTLYRKKRKKEKKTKKAKEEEKKIFKRPSQKVAALLIALGPATASEILKNIKDEDLLEQITLDIANLGKVSDEDLNEVLKDDNSNVMILLETMSGKGSEVGSRFEELRAIIDAVGREDIGVCLDPCHIYDAGYDIVNDLDGVLAEFDRVIGLDRLKALHINDSKNPFASHKDRHECIGQGSLGLGFFEKLMSHPLLADKPMILETPNELPGYQAEIALLRSKI